MCMGPENWHLLTLVALMVNLSVICQRSNVRLSNRSSFLVTFRHVFEVISLPKPLHIEIAFSMTTNYLLKKAASTTCRVFIIISIFNIHSKYSFRQSPQLHIHRCAQITGWSVLAIGRWILQLPRACLPGMVGFGGHPEWYAFRLLHDVRESGT